MFFRSEYRRNTREDRRKISDIKKRMAECEQVLNGIYLEESDLHGHIEQLDARLNSNVLREFRSQNFFRKWLKRAKVRQVTDKALYEYCKGMLPEQLEKSA